MFRFEISKTAIAVMLVVSASAAQAQTEVSAVLADSLPGIRRTLGLDGPMGIGLRLSDAAAQAGDLDATADSDETLRLLTAILAGIGSQQVANEPEASYDNGIFTTLTDRALAMFVDQHRKGKS